MELSDIYIYALKELRGFDNEAIEIAIELAKNDIVETIDEFVDFLNFNIEDQKFPQISQTYDIKIIKNAVECARKNQHLIHRVNDDDTLYPKKLKLVHIDNVRALFYKGNLKNINHKTIMITGSPTSTNEAKLAAKYFGKLFATEGYNILTTYSGQCEQSAFAGCSDASGISIIFVQHNIDKLSAKVMKAIQSDLEEEHATIVSACNTSNDVIPLDSFYRCLANLLDCLIIPQLSFGDKIMQLVQMCIDMNKPVYLIKYKKAHVNEYDCAEALQFLGANFLTSNTALKRVQATIGNAK